MEGIGPGDVMRRKRAARTNIGIDLDERVIARWRTLGRPDVTLIHSDALNVLPTLDLRGDDLVYCDPPYLPDARRRPRVYRHDYDVVDHERLIGLLRTLPCRIVLSGYQRRCRRCCYASRFRPPGTITRTGVSGNARVIEIARREGRYTGCKADHAQHRRIIALREAGMSIAKTAELTPCSPAQVKRVMALHRGKTCTTRGAEKMANCM